jgi:hypothetical protein
MNLGLRLLDYFYRDVIYNVIGEAILVMSEEGFIARDQKGEEIFWHKRPFKILLALPNFSLQQMFFHTTCAYYIASSDRFEGSLRTLAVNQLFEAVRVRATMLGYRDRLARSMDQWVAWAKKKGWPHEHWKEHYPLLK